MAPKSDDVTVHRVCDLCSTTPIHVLIMSGAQRQATAWKRKPDAGTVACRWIQRHSSEAPSWDGGGAACGADLGGSSKYSIASATLS